MARIILYSKVSQSIDDGDYNEPLPIKGDCVLLESVTKHWYGDLNKGLARYIDKDLDKYVDKIQYFYENGFICFKVYLTNSNTSLTMIKYRGQDITLYRAICSFISSQISDGWGENGILLYNLENDEVIHADCSHILYEIDYDATSKFMEEHKDSFTEIENYYIYKKINNGCM